MVHSTLPEIDNKSNLSSGQLRISYTEGKSLGLVEGSHQKALQTAKMMLTMGYPLGDICKIVELSKEEVESLQ